MKPNEFQTVKTVFYLTLLNNLNMKPGKPGFFNKKNPIIL